MNKYQKAIKTLKEEKELKFLIYEGQEFDDEAPTMFDLYHHEMFILDELVEKATPKKHIGISRDYNYFMCPNCRLTIFCSCDFNEHKYCLNCGQALDWSKE